MAKLYLRSDSEQVIHSFWSQHGGNNTLYWAPGLVAPPEMIFIPRLCYTKGTKLPLKECYGLEPQKAKDTHKDGYATANLCTCGRLSNLLPLRLHISRER